LASPGGAAAAPLLPWVDDVIAWQAIWQDISGHTSFFIPALTRLLAAGLPDTSLQPLII
jgi:hypothetical protein